MYSVDMPNVDYDSKRNKKKTQHTKQTSASVSKSFTWRLKDMFIPTDVS